MLGQKNAVVAEVVSILGARFTKYKDVALNVLTASELETVKHNVALGILNGSIEYGKDRTKTSEVNSYARSMVMNHLKKAKELNGNTAYASKSSVNPSSKGTKAQSAPNNVKNGINTALLPEELRELVQSL